MGAQCSAKRQPSPVIGTPVGVEQPTGKATWYVNRDMLVFAEANPTKFVVMHKNRHATATHLGALVEIVLAEARSEAKKEIMVANETGMHLAYVCLRDTSALDSREILMSAFSRPRSF